MVNMCGRYNFSTEESTELRRIVEEVGRRNTGAEYKPGEVFPTNTMPVLLWEANQPTAALMGWGFPAFQGNRKVINARAETAGIKPMFRKSLDECRCVVPSSGFYEWDTEKQKYLFRLPEQPELYMAGLYNKFAGKHLFCIVTTTANASISDIHSRMPVVLPKSRVCDWLESRTAAEELLHTVPPVLTHQAVTAQVRFW